MITEKTHWLQSPNKNYLGHWDLPEKTDIIVTIDRAVWEEVKNPIINTKEAKRVVYFKEDIKPLICNQTNAQAIIKSTGVKYMEDSQGQKIQIYIGKFKDKQTKEMVDCLRVRHAVTGLKDDTHKELSELFLEKQHELTPQGFESAKIILTEKREKEYSRLLNHLKNL